MTSFDIKNLGTSSRLLTLDGNKPQTQKKPDMLTDTALRKLKPNGATYKVADRDGIYVTVSWTPTHIADHSPGAAYDPADPSDKGGVAKGDLG